MKTRVSFIAVLALTAGMIFTSCEDNMFNQGNENSILPSRFKVDIPNSLSNEDLKSAPLKSSQARTGTQADTLKGDGIYRHLNTFIAIGEGAADIVQAIIWSIAIHNIDQVVELTYVSDEDNRVKHLWVESEVTFDDRVWEYQLTITDQEREGEEDGGIGMQIFWNQSPVEGIALIKPSNCNVRGDAYLNEAIFSIEYSEKGMGVYENYMVIGIADMPMPGAWLDRFAINSLRMFVGKNGETIDVYGSSNHPNAKFFTDKTGYTWSFVASGNETDDIAVAEVSLPPSTLDETDRDIILKDYSIKNVLTEEVNTFFVKTFGILPDSASLAGYLKDADAPGYFNAGGFVQGGIAPNDEYEPLEKRLDALSPYNPSEVSIYSIEFKK